MRTGRIARPAEIFASAFIAVLLSVCGVRTLAASDGALPEVKSGGLDGGPLAILFLSDDAILEESLDETYAKELREEGYAYAVASYFKPIDPAFLKKFNVIVLDKLPRASEEARPFGWKMIYFRKLIQQVWQCAREGTGVLVYPHLFDPGGPRTGGWNDVMEPWNIRIGQFCVVDPSLAFEPWRVSAGENYYCWTENLPKHPVTNGLNRIYYAAANFRWDDCYATPPLYFGKEWTPILKGMAGARIAASFGGKWYFEPDPPEGCVMGAVRQADKGRMAVLSIYPGYTHRYGYTKFESRAMGECHHGVIDGIVLKKGNGRVPSDTGRLVSRLYRWLARESTAAGFGGYRTGEPVPMQDAYLTEEEKHFEPVLDFDNLVLPPSWKHCPVRVKIDDKTYYPEVSDPRIPGDVQFFKGLVGVRSAYSDGNGRVEDYVAAAREAGYSFLVFGETFEDLTEAEFDALRSDCKRNTTEDFICLPGFDIMDPYGAHFLVVAPPFYPRPQWLSADGKRLVQTQMIYLLYNNHMVVAHRPESSPIPQERLKHFQGLSVYTYRDGKLADNSRHAYAWQVQNASNPHPVAVHEIRAPNEVADAAGKGFQQLAPGDTVASAVRYFRSNGHYFEAPARYMISEGPVVTDFIVSPKDCGPEEENRMRFRAFIGVRAERPLKTVTLYDGFRPVRRWRPEGNEFTTHADFHHCRQYHLYVEAEDESGRRVLTNSVRTVPKQYHFRCTDRQNWLGHVAAYYTGTDNIPARGLALSLPLRNTREGTAGRATVPGTYLAPKLSFPFTGNDVAICDTVLNEKYVEALFRDVGYDARPSLPSKTSAVFSGRQRHLRYVPEKGSPLHVALVEYNIRLRRDSEPVDPEAPFPNFAILGEALAMADDTGKIAVRRLRRDEVFDVPVGALVGECIVLTEGMQVYKGRLGKKRSGEARLTIPSGTAYTIRFLVPTRVVPAQQGRSVFGDKAEEWLQWAGFAKEKPYSLRIVRGQEKGTRFAVPVEADAYGVAGAVTKTAQAPTGWIPLEIAGLDERWPAGLWRDGGGIEYCGVFEGTAWPRLDVAKAGAFYAGNLLVADTPGLVLQILEWTPETIHIEAHNPTDRTIEATVSTPAEIKNLKAFEQQISVPAGSSRYERL